MDTVGEGGLTPAEQVQGFVDFLTGNAAPQCKRAIDNPEGDGLLYCFLERDHPCDHGYILLRPRDERDGPAKTLAELEARDPRDTGASAVEIVIVILVVVVILAVIGAL